MLVIQCRFSKVVGLDDISIALAQVVFQAAQSVNSPFITPTLRLFYDPYSYLFNTDGDTFTKNGFPVVLLNEHINLYQNFDRVGYHDSLDTSKLIDWDYGTSVAKVAIETVAQLASVTEMLYF